MNEVDVDVADSELCEVCHAREAYGTFNYEDVEMWLCDYCAENAVVEERNGAEMIIFHLEC